MNDILYGNLRIQLVAGAGSRVDRRPRQAPLNLVPRLDRDRDSDQIFLIGRATELDHLRRAVRARRPLQVSGPCGAGKTTLLRQVAANAVAEGLSGVSVYLTAGRDGVEDLLHRLVAEMYTSDPPVKLTPSQCGQILGQVQALVVFDDVAIGPAEYGDLLRALPGCSVLVSSQQPVQDGTDDQLAVPGLDEDEALQLIAAGLGRPLRDSERPAARRLAAAVGGQPLHLRQAAALAAEGRMSLTKLAEMAVRHPGRLDRLSIDALAGPRRRALAVLALAAGGLLPAELVGLMGGIAEISECLRVLHRQELAEQRQDRFGLPACRAERYRQVLVEDFHRTAAIREIVSWLASHNPAAPDSISVASAALAIAEWAADGEDWPAVVQLVRVIEPALMLAGRWQACQHALAMGLHAAQTIGDHLSEAFFAHEQGSLALARDDLITAQQQLGHALRLRERHGDRDGAAVTRHNLDVLQPPAPALIPPARKRPPQPWPKVPVVVGSGVLAAAVLVAGVLAAGIGHGHRHPHPTLGSSSAVITPHHTQSPNTGQGIGSSIQGLSGGSSPPSTRTSSGPARPPLVQAANIGSVHFGSSITKVVTVHNPNTQPLVITSTQTAVPFSITQGNCLEHPVAGRGSCEITVTFTAFSVGDSSGALTVQSGAGSVKTQLTGAGYVQLTVDILDGTGTISDGQKFNCTPTSCQQDITGNVTVTAAGTSGYEFNGWADSCPLPGSSQTCIINPSAGDITIQAYFYVPIGASIH